MDLAPFPPLCVLSWWDLWGDLTHEKKSQKLFCDWWLDGRMLYKQWLDQWELVPGWLVSGWLPLASSFLPSVWGWSCHYAGRGQLSARTDGSAGLRTGGLIGTIKTHARYYFCQAIVGPPRHMEWLTKGRQPHIPIVRIYSRIILQIKKCSKGPKAILLFMEGLLVRRLNLCW